MSQRFIATVFWNEDESGEFIVRLPAETVGGKHQPEGLVWMALTAIADEALGLRLDMATITGGHVHLKRA